MSLDAYKIGIQIALVDNVSRGLMTLAGHFNRLNLDADALKARLDKIGKMIDAGGVLSGAGAKGFKMLDGPLDAAKQYQTELQRFSQVMPGDAMASQADKFAKSLNVMGQSSLDNLKLLRETTATLGSFDQAKLVMPQLAQAKSGVMAVMGSDAGGKFEESALSALKTKQLQSAITNPNTGLIAPQRVSDVLDSMRQTYVATNGKATSDDYAKSIALPRTATSTSGVAKPSMQALELEYQAKLANLQMTLGEHILPVAIAGLEKLNALLQSVTEFAKEHPTLTKVFLGLAAVLAGAAVGAGVVLQFGAALTALSGIFPVIMSVIGMVMTTIGAGIGAAMAAAVGAISAVALPLTLVLAAVAGWAILIYKNWNEIKPRLLGAFELVKQSADWVQAHLFVFFERVKTFAAGLWEHVQPILSKIKSVVATLWGYVEPTFDKIKARVQDAWDSFSRIAAMPFTFIQAFIKSVVDAFRSFAQRFNLGDVVDYIDTKLKKAYTDSIVRDHAASYSNEGHNRNPVSNTVKPADARPVALKGDVVMDGRAVGTVVWKHADNHLARPQTGSSDFNTAMHVSPSGYTTYA
ncbi:hypothetical protein [Ralstonia mojiangensis]|uniref:Phage tail tape measure protein n=1 Tax=Ralstonia mojiangensis TaxID=2953895 RepID=A0ABT2L844_9RALS|nr:hypothetical protein [Ralstonia mojiangensis]MCO5413708.1 hypothetical protein [Ralstonia mojiangensis]MCT7298764.1 hypothetical protein [Ralstonia mojiangensis]MCT7311592.1 hypothetical protein [Ralstonia mojiangensis]